MTTTAETAQVFEAVPMVINYDRAEVGSKILRSLCRMETIFTDYQRACDDVCLNCEVCQARMNAVAAMLLSPTARVWEVWRVTDEPDVVGILYLTEISPGNTATAHYAFWDGGLRDKTHLIENMITWSFEDHVDDNWLGLRRLSLEVPTYAHALARHAHSRLGFGGDYTYKTSRGHGKGSKIQIEGVKRKAINWRGQVHDILVMGRLRDG